MTLGRSGALGRKSSPHPSLSLISCIYVTNYKLGDDVTRVPNAILGILAPSWAPGSPPQQGGPAPALRPVSPADSLEPSRSRRCGNFSNVHAEEHRTGIGSPAEEELGSS